MKGGIDISTRNRAKNSEEMSYQCSQRGWREWKDFCGLARGGCLGLLLLLEPSCFRPLR